MFAQTSPSLAHVRSPWPDYGALLEVLSTDPYFCAIEARRMARNETRIRKKRILSLQWIGATMDVQNEQSEVGTDPAGRKAPT
ncbi:hypothetical protein GCM10007173_31870 [Glutamicibacter ardleyensis]|uniref:Uncharacterized protein n=1 Tax=Glutamicibacter ardleyensis TaxID=225894 RepID=A0ABQ2DS42_9MICC|nr:hypothetical protein GCM10007173_31870 [Glutamicibacter ardleyensis]